MRDLPTGDEMEVMLQWLDDLDDLVCALAQVAERLRWPSLKIAFGATLYLVIAHIAALPETWGPLAIWVASSGLILWGLGSSLAVRQALTWAASGAELGPSA